MLYDDDIGVVNQIVKEKIGEIKPVKPTGLTKAEVEKIIDAKIKGLKMELSKAKAETKKAAIQLKYK